MKKILIVEDDQDIINLFKLHLTGSAFELVAFTSGSGAIAYLKSNRCDFILLDIMLPDKDGIEVCKSIRQLDIQTPIMMVSARSEEIDKVLALEVGADDYLTKPFSIRELIARIKAHLRSRELLAQTPAIVPQEIRFRELVVDNNLKKVSLNNKRLELTQKEFDLLLQLVRNPGKTYSRLELLTLVWGYTISGYEHTVTSHINRLRIKIEKDLNDPQYILTSWGTGYRVADES